MTNEDQKRHEAASGMTDVAARKVEQDGRRAADVVRHDVEGVTDQVRADASEAIEATKEQLNSIRHDAEDMANKRKDGFADSIDGIAGAMRKAADQLAEDGGPGADLTRQFASRLGQFSKTLKHNDIGGLIGKTEDFGRRQPAAFLGASMLLGFAASRFAVASGRRHRDASTAPNQNSGDTR